jgi:hypothetical protein
MQVRDPSGTLQSLNQLEPWEAERTLGVRLTPDGNMMIQYEWMLQTARKCGGHNSLRSPSSAFNLVSLAIHYS